MEFEMGAWSASINGNDTAADLLSEYTCTFYKYGADDGLKKLDEYVRTMFDESDSQEWCDYIYSLANFMWKKGILTEKIKKQAIGMIDSGFGLENWGETGEQMLKERQRVLKKLKEKLLSPMCAPKRIRPNVYMNEIFNNGDVVAVKLKTKDKVYSHKAEYNKKISAEEFHSYDGKYILIQKVCTECSWHSSVVPEIGDKWAVFRLLEGVYDEIPESVDIDRLKYAYFQMDNFLTPFFYCESTMFYFRKRGYKVICNCDISGDTEIEKYNLCNFNQKKDLFLGVCNDWNDADSDLLSAMWNKTEIEKYSGDIDILEKLIYRAVKYGCYDPDLSRADNDAVFEENGRKAIAHFNENITREADVYTLRYGSIIGLATVTGNRIDDLYIKGNRRKLGFGTELINHVKNLIGDGAFFELPKHLLGTQNGYLLEKLCKSADIEFRK